MMLGDAALKIRAALCAERAPAPDRKSSPPLTAAAGGGNGCSPAARLPGAAPPPRKMLLARAASRPCAARVRACSAATIAGSAGGTHSMGGAISEERRVGQEVGRKLRFRRSADHSIHKLSPPLRHISSLT